MLVDNLIDAGGRFGMTPTGKFASGVVIFKRSFE